MKMGGLKLATELLSANDSHSLCWNSSLCSRSTCNIFLPFFLCFFFLFQCFTWILCYPYMSAKFLYRCHCFLKEHKRRCFDWLGSGLLPTHLFFLDKKKLWQKGTGPVLRIPPSLGILCAGVHLFSYNKQHKLLPNLALCIKAYHGLLHSPYLLATSFKALSHL